MDECIWIVYISKELSHFDGVLKMKILIVRVSSQLETCPIREVGVSYSSLTRRRLKLEGDLEIF